MPARDAKGRFTAGGGGGGGSSMGLSAWLNFGADDAISSMGRAGAALASLHQNAKQIAAGMAQLGSSFTNATLAMAPVTAGIYMGAKSAGTFEAQMSAVSAKLDEGEQKMMPAYIAKAKQLGRDTQFSATEAASGMEMLAAAGFKTADVMTAIDGVTAMAAAEQMDLAQAASITSNVLRGFGLDGSKATMVADQLAVASAETNTTIAGLGEALSYAQGAAKSMGLDVTKTTAALATISNAGYQGSSAGTMFAQTLSHLAKPARQAQEQLDRLGINVEKIFATDQPVQSLVATFSDRMKNMGSDVERTKVLTQIFGQEGGRAMAALLTDFNGPEKALLSLTEKLANAQGAAAKMAATRMDNFLGQLKLLGSSAEGFNIEFFGPILKVLTPILKDVTTVLNGVIEGIQFLREESVDASDAMLEGWNKINPTVQSIARGISAGMDIVIGYIGKVRAKFQEFSDWIEAHVSGDTIETITRLGTVFLVVGGALAPLAAAAIGFGAVLSYTIIPAITGLISILMGVAGILIGPVGIALALVVAGFYAFKQDNESFGQSALRIWDGIKAIVLDVWNNALMPLWQGITEGLTPALEPLRDAWNGIMGEVKKLWYDIMDAFSSGGDGLKIDWLDIGRAIGAIVGAMAVAVGTVIEFIIHLFRRWIGIAKEAYQGIRLIFSGHIVEGLIKLGEAIVDYLVAPIRNVVALMIKLADSIPHGSALVPQGLRDFAEKGIRADDNVEKHRQIVKNTLLREADNKKEAAGDIHVTAKTPPIKIDNKVNLVVDGKVLAKSVTENQIEFDQRSGVKATPWAKRSMLEHSAVPVRSGG